MRWKSSLLKRAAGCVECFLFIVTSSCSISAQRTKSSDINDRDEWTTCNDTKNGDDFVNWPAWIHDPKSERDESAPIENIYDLCRVGFVSKKVRTAINMRLKWAVSFFSFFFNTHCCRYLEWFQIKLQRKPENIEVIIEYVTNAYFLEL